MRHTAISTTARRARVALGARDPARRARAHGARDRAAAARGACAPADGCGCDQAASRVARRAVLLHGQGQYSSSDDVAHKDLASEPLITVHDIALHSITIHYIMLLYFTLHLLHCIL